MRINFGSGLEKLEPLSNAIDRNSRFQLPVAITLRFPTNKDSY
jgi:hypothetical protein